MIEALHIENIAVVKSLNVDLGAGLTVLSGETGAGKSIMIDSLNLLMGGRADKDLIRRGETKAQVSAIFSHLSEETERLMEEMDLSSDDGTVMLSRTVTQSGSTARFNGRAIPLSVLRELSVRLFNIHGQNDNQQLLDPKNHVTLLDSYAGCKTERDAYAKSYGEILRLRGEIDALRRDEKEQNRLCEILRIQIAEIDGAKLKQGEEEALTELAKKLRSVEQITKCCTLVEKALKGGEKGKGAIYLTDRAASALETVSDALPDAETLSERLNQIRYELEDISEAVADLNDIDGEDAIEKLDRTEGRLHAIELLKRKYGSTVEEILEYRNESAETLDRIEHAEDRLIEWQEELQKEEEKARTLAMALRDKRRSAARSLVKKVTETLTFLDMPKVKFEVGMKSTVDFEAYGCDKVEFLIATNAGEDLMPMAKIASGGELARIMLSLKNVLNECDGVHTVIFDEIDTGISGKTSRKVGIKLKEIGKGAQVLCVTHSAQIASLADQHLYISKKEIEGRMQTEVKELNEEERVEEIARILGGIEITEAQRRAAREMIDEGKIY